jgi:hypothetical protein
VAVYMQASTVDVLESLYAHFTKLFAQSQNFFLAGLVIRVLLALTRGLRKSKYIAFPIYRALSSVYPSGHFLPAFPRSLASGRLPPQPGTSRASTSPLSKRERERAKTLFVRRAQRNG